MIPNNQKGQASVFVLAFIGVVLVCTIFLYQSGRITTEKMQLQNAADAAAYSASILEARSLNFCAYTNRAMVANEVGIGQLVGMLSVADEIKAIGINLVDIAEIIEGILLLFVPPPFGEAILGFLEPPLLVPMDFIGGELESVGTTLEDTMLPVIKGIIKALSVVNDIYSYGQTAYHGATIFMVTTTVFKTIEDNVPGTASFNKSTDIFNPNRPGAHLSNLGFFAMAGHIPSYWQGYTKRYKPPNSKGYKTLYSKDKEGMHRLAGTIRTARDPFSSDFGSSGTRDWDLGIKLDNKFNFELGGGVMKGYFQVYFLSQFTSLGASELRYKETNYNWSAIDTALFESVFKLSGKATIKVLKTTHTLFNKTFKVNLPKIPLGGGGYQAVSEKELTVADMPVGLRKATNIPGPYGYGTKEILSWLDASAEMEENTIETYSGLKPYRGMVIKKDAKGYTLPFISPFYLVGVVRKVNDLNKTGPQFSGNLAILKDDPDITEIGAIAKAEIYYKRPTDLSYFSRTDKNTEKNNIFGPFWQAKLSKTNDIDRLLALLVQHNVIWLPGVNPDLKKLEKSLEKGLKSILSIFL